MYKYCIASAEGLKHVIFPKDGEPFPPNPIREKVRGLPLSTMRLGDALYIKSSEVRPYILATYRECANRYNRKYDNMFKIIKYPDKSLEIVRIK